MALPPKSDDSPSTARGSAAEKKTRRPRVVKPKAEKSDKAKAPKRGKPVQMEIPTGDNDERPTPRESAPAPGAAQREPERVWEPDRAREPERSSQEQRIPQPERESERPASEREQAEAPRVEERPAPADRQEPAERRDETAPAEASAPPSGSDASAGTAQGAPAPQQSHPNQNQPQHKQQHQGGGGGRGDWQGQGGDRGFWKHGKRKRGRHGGGPWQPGGGGGGGGGPGREQHPPQPPPPSNVPVFGDLPNPSRFNDLAALDALADQLSNGEGEPLWLNQIYAQNLADVTGFARRLGITLDGVPNRRQVLTEIFKFAAEKKRSLRDLGYVDQNDRGSFVVHEHVNYRLYPEDAYLAESLVKRYGLKRGHRVEVTLQPPQEGERCPSVVRIDSIMGMTPDDISKVMPFEELVPYYPLQRILLENTEVHTKDVSMRAVDILTPIGFGQRGLIVAPPRTGKTILLQNIANSISANSPEVKLILLLIDERPEEVTDFRRHTKGEVVSSTFDETPENHVHCAEMVIEICRRRVEMGEHVVVLLDSITRLARAYNALTSGGKTMSGGLESNALQKPKRFFGSARNIEGGGSLTIIASALIDTGSRMDEIIFEEFKGTGNSELHLDRGLVERRIFPAINIDRSGTRKEELIYHPDELQRIYGLRRAMQGLGPIESMEMLITRLKKTKSNAEFLLSLAPK
ncbi:MAG: transcription termination factor Rho [Opitutaceae bacterium]|nr:transcription termination factor Rho [Opitutaceae bacterium]